MANEIIEEDISNIISAKLPWDRLEGKRILVSGANGFLPAYMVETILALNQDRFRKPAHLTLLVRNKSHATKRFQRYKDNKDITFLVQDVCTPTKLRKGVDFIIHAASQASPKYFGSDPVGTLKANVTGTINLLELAREKKAESFFYMSGGEVYGHVQNGGMPIKEDEYGPLDPLSLRSCYAESKRMGENICVSYSSQYDIDTKIARPFHTYGPGMRLDDGRVYADFVSNIVSKKDIILKSDGSAVRPFCYLVDATIGFYTILFKGENSKAYNVSNDSCVISMKDLAEKLTGIFPEYGLKVVMDKNTVGGSYIKSPYNIFKADITKLRRLGYAPTYTLEEGFKRTVESYQ